MATIRVLLNELCRNNEKYGGSIFLSV